MSIAKSKTWLRAVAKESWLLFIALSAVNASNYVFHVAASRSLGNEQYGALGSVLAVLTILSVPLSAIQATVARRVASETGAEGSHWQATFRSMIPVALALSTVFAVASPVLTSFLRLDSWLTTFFVALYILPAVLVVVLRGALQGQMRFARLAFVSVVPVVFRLIIGLTLLELGAGVAGAVAASVIAESIGVGAALLMLRSISRAVARVLSMRAFLREVGPVLLGFAAMWVLIELDIVLARHYLPARDAGHYAAAGLLGRAVLFVPGAISLIALPHFSRHRGRGEEAYRWLMVFSMAVVGLSLVAAVVLLVGRELLVTLTYGSGFEEAANLLPLVAIAMVGFGIANLLVHFHIAAGSRVAGMMWLAVVVEVALITIYHESSQAILFVVLGVAWASAIVGFLLTRSMALALPGTSGLPADVTVYPRDRGKINDPELSLVVPYFNAGREVAANLAELEIRLEQLGKDFEVIVVSDGSTDGDDQLLTRTLAHASLVHYPERQGKGVALRVGMTRARGKYVAFIDADGELDAAEFKGFMAIMDLYDPDLVIGSKRHPLSKVNYPPTRRVMSWVYHRLVRVLFGLNVRDTQTGMKLIRRDVLDAVLPRMLEKRFAFDLEFLVVARLLGFSRIFEAPINLDYKFSSTVSPQAAFRIVLDTTAIYYRRYILRYYDDSTRAIQSSEETSVQVRVEAAGPRVG
jgi:O-antigen/teichoic acid export membrane protein